MITRVDGHLVGSVFSMVPFTSPCYVDSWHSDHDQCWFYFLCLFLPLPWALRQWSVDCFDFFYLFLPILFRVFWSLSASSVIAEAVVNWLVRLFASLCTYSDHFRWFYAHTCLWSFPVMSIAHNYAIWTSVYCLWSARYILLDSRLVIVVCDHCLWRRVIHFWFWAHTLSPYIALSDTLLVCDDFCFSGFFEFSLQLCAILI